MIFATNNAHKLDEVRAILGDGFELTTLREAGISAPLLIGGATTSAMHTALKIAPVYDGPVVYVKDASQNSGVAAALLGDDTRDAFIAQLKQEQEALRQAFAQKEQTPLLSLEEARKRKPNFFD